MKIKVLSLLGAILISIGIPAAAQSIIAQLFGPKEIVPYGQTTHTPWEAKYFYATNDSGEAPADNWYAADFDDSAWGDIQGPISTTNDYSRYYATAWQASYSTYWVRRHFELSDFNASCPVKLFVTHDDGCDVYLNGTLIYQNSNSNNSTYSYELSDDEKALLTSGSNVLAVRVSDSGGGDAFMDFGLVVYPENYPKQPVNANCSSTSSWSRSNSYSSNGVFYSDYSDFYCQQTLTDMPEGLYMLSVQGYELTNNNYFSIAWRNWPDADISTAIFAGEATTKVKNLLDDAVATNIYSDYYTTDISTYVPKNASSAATAFASGLYSNCVYTYLDEVGSLTVGVKNIATRSSRTSYWDNFQLLYLGETELNTLMTMLPMLQMMPMNADIKSELNALATSVKALTTYKEQGKAIADASTLLVSVENSIATYQKLQKALETVNNSLAAESADMPAAAVASAKALAQEVAAAIQAGSYSDNEAKKKQVELARVATRLSYRYLDINVEVPGALGDSILKYVDNFVDVQSLKIAGTLNDADITTIRTRLTELREIDMADVVMTALPNEFFRQRSKLTRIVLPTSLTSIGEYALYGCSGITDIVIPEGVKAIGYQAFYRASRLQELVLPEGLISLGDYAFQECYALKHVKFPSTLSTISYGAFYYCEDLEDVEFAEGLVLINSNAFTDCNLALKSLSFPSTLRTIGYYAFERCQQLADIKFNEGLNRIYDYAFDDCDALTEVTLPSTLYNASYSPFSSCDNLRKVTCLAVAPPSVSSTICNVANCELYVPSVALNIYKQTEYWDDFPTILPIDFLPGNIIVLDDLKLTLPQTLPDDYKPYVYLWFDQINGENSYGHLTVNGESTLSIGYFGMQLNYYYTNYYWGRDYNNNCALIANAALRADKVEIFNYFYNDSWSFITFPYDVKVSDIVPTSNGATNWIIRGYSGENRASGDTGNTWVKMDEDATLQAGVGYIIQSSRYVNNSWQSYSAFKFPAVNNSKKNNIFASDDVKLTLSEYPSEYAHNYSWNLIGNPYPCYYDIRFMDFEAPITVWDYNNYTYKAYSPMDDAYILLPGEAFFVQKPVDKSELTFSKEGRQTYHTARTISAAPAFGGFAKQRSVVNITLSDGSVTDQTRVVVNADAKMDYETIRDAAKFFPADARAPQLYTSLAGVYYAINERPMADGCVELTVDIAADGLHTIALSGSVEGYDIILEDRTTGDFIEMTDEGEYSFQAKAGKGQSRFVIHFVSRSTTGIDGIGADVDALSGADIFTLSGMRAAQPLNRGVYIVNGKKVFIK